MVVVGRVLEALADYVDGQASKADMTGAAAKITSDATEPEWEVVVQGEINGAFELSIVHRENHRGGRTWGFGATDKLILHDNHTGGPAVPPDRLVARAQDIADALNAPKFVAEDRLAGSGRDVFYTRARWEMDRDELIGTLVTVEWRGESRRWRVRGVESHALAGRIAADAKIGLWVEPAG